MSSSIVFGEINPPMHSMTYWYAPHPPHVLQTWRKQLRGITVWTPVKQQCLQRAPPLRHTAGQYGHSCCTEPPILLCKGGFWITLFAQNSFPPTYSCKCVHVIKVFKDNIQHQGQCYITTIQKNPRIKEASSHNWFSSSTASNIFICSVEDVRTVKCGNMINNSLSQWSIDWGCYLVIFQGRHDCKSKFTTFNTILDSIQDATYLLKLLCTNTFSCCNFVPHNYNKTLKEKNV